MKYLTLSDWKPYFWDEENDRFSGIKFENMVAQLLKLEYPALRAGENWQRTKESWDGKKDFFQRYFDGNRMALRWAECKSYQKPVTLNILTPTLIMSTLRNANEVIFFSYSRLNREAIRGLQEFADVHRKRVVVYDDEKLEDLIIQYKDDDKFSFHLFFPDICAKFADISKTDPFFYEVDAYVYRQNCKYTMTELKMQKLRVNELFELRIFLINNELSEKTVVLEIDMEANSSYRFLDCMDRQLRIQKRIDLKGGEVSVIRTTFKITGFSHYIYLPQIRLSCGKQDTQFVPGYFKGEWLLNTPYLGDLKRLNADVKTTLQHYETVLTVYGTSGVGKTRYLREIQDSRLLIGEKTLWSDPGHANGNAITWLRQIFSKLYSLPLIHLEEYTPQLFPEVKTRIVIDVLYNNHFRFTFDNYENVAAALVEAAAWQKTLLIVDNVQDFDEDTVQILNCVLNLISDMPDVHFLFSFNTDLLDRGKAAVSLFQRLRSLYQSDEVHFPLLQITGLSPRASELFVHYCFSDHPALQRAEDQTWRPVIQKISRSAACNPLYLEQILLYLREEEIIRAEDGHLYLSNNRKLQEYLSKLPDTTQETLQKRWSPIRRNMIKAGNSPDRVLRFLSFFGEIDGSLVRELKLNEDVIDYLVAAGFLQWDAGLTFYHPLIAKFFQRRYAGLNKAEAALCVRALKACGMEYRFIGQLYICILNSQAPRARQIDEAIDALINNRIAQGLIPQYGDVLFLTLSRNGGLPEGSPEKLLHFYILYTEQQKIHRSMSEVVQAYTDIYQNLLSKFPEFRQLGDTYFMFVKEYMNALLTEHKNRETLELGNKLLEELDQFSFSSDTQASSSMAMILNRMHVAADRMEPPKSGIPDSPHAQDLLKESLKIFKRIRNPDGIIQCEIDYGYVFYLFGGSIKSVVLHWKNAVKVWNRYKDDVPLWEGGVYFHKAMAHTLLRAWPRAKEAVDRVVCFHQRTLRNPYYYVKALTLRALIFLMEEQSFETVLRAVNEAEEVCTENGYKGTLPVCSHIRAIAYDRLVQEHHLAGVYYEKALTQYIDIFSEPQEEDRSLTVLLTLALALRRLQGIKVYSEVSRLKSREVSAKLQYILESDETTWDRISKEPPPKGFLYFADREINYPCV